MENVSKTTYKGDFAIALQGQIDTANAATVEESIKNLLEGQEVTLLVLDAQNLRYISSAGLRVLLRLLKSGKKLKMVNVSPEVYEILEVTGFSEMITVEKAFREVSIEGCEIIGQGSNGIVYRFGIGSDIGGTDLHHGRCNVGILLNGERTHRQTTQKENYNG